MRVFRGGGELWRQGFECRRPRLSVFVRGVRLREVEGHLERGIVWRLRLKDSLVRRAGLCQRR
jgi:hypothetical protein